MKKSIILFTAAVLPLLLPAQNTGFGTATPDPAAKLEISASDKGVLLPRLTQANRPANPVAGLIIYQTDNNPGYYCYNGSEWLRWNNSAMGGNGAAEQVSFFNAGNLQGSGSLGFKAKAEYGGAKIFTVNGLNNGTVGDGYNNWIGAHFGGSGGNRVVIGVQNGEATIGAHSYALDAWRRLVLSPNGTVNIGTRAMVANPAGEIAPIPLPVADNLGNHSATQNIRLSSNAVSNTAAASGLMISTAGNVGVNLVPQGLLHIPTSTLAYNGTFSGDITTPPQAYASEDFGQGTSPGAAFDNNTNLPWKTLNNSPQFIAQDFNTPQIIRRYRFCPYYTQAFFTEPFVYTVRWQLQGSNNNATWITLDDHTSNETSFTFSYQSIISFNYTPYYHLPNQTTAYRYYRIYITGFRHEITFEERTPQINEIEMETENLVTSYGVNGFVVGTEGRIAINHSAPTANLDVNGTVKFRNGAGAGKYMIYNVAGNAAEWGNNGIATVNGTVTGNLTGNVNGGASASFALNNNYLSNDGITNGIQINNTGNAGIGTAASATNRLLVTGTGGTVINTTNNGTGTSDWIALNSGGTAGDRLVAGVLNGVATIGGHNATLNNWSHAVINPAGAGNATVTIGSDANISPTNIEQATPNADVNGVKEYKLIVNGSIRQSVYTTAVSIPASGVAYVTWDHNLGYGPITMFSTDQNGGGVFMDYVKVTTLNNNANQTIFVLRNRGGNNASGTLRWILVW
jgi:hypothetical protein